MRASVDQLTETERPRRRSTLRVRARSLRAFSLPASTLPVLVAAAAVARPAQWRWDVLAVSVAGAALLHLAGNLLNDYFDFRGGADRRLEDDEGRPGRVLVHGLLRPADVLAQAALALLLACGAGAYIAWRCGAGPLAFALAGLAGLYAYTGPPLRLKHRGLGELTIFAVFGPLLMLGAAWAQTGRFEPAALLLSVPIGCATTAILVGNNLRDRQEDRQAGIRTLAQLAGGRVARAAYMVLLLASALLPAAAAAAGFGPPGLLAAPLALLAAGRPAVSVWRGRRAPDIDRQTAQYGTILMLLILVACICPAFQRGL